MVKFVGLFNQLFDEAYARENGGMPWNGMAHTGIVNLGTPKIQTLTLM